jgi:hypothetical protein
MPASLPWIPLLPGQVLELVPDLFFEMVERRRASTCAKGPSVSVGGHYVARESFVRTSSAVLGFDGWQTVDLAMDLLDGTIESRATNELHVTSQT